MNEEEIKQLLYNKLEVPNGEITTTGAEINKLIKQAIDILVEVTNRNCDE